MREFESHLHNESKTSRKLYLNWNSCTISLLVCASVPFKFNKHVKNALFNFAAIPRN